MFKKLNYLIALLALSVGSLSAYIHPCPGKWGIEGEFLYLYPSLDDTYFVFDGATFPPGTRKNNDFDFHPGFRIGGVYGLCDCAEAQLFYTYLNAHQKKTINGTTLWGAVGVPDLLDSFEAYTGSASSDLKLRYQRLDAMLAFHLFDCSRVDFYVQGGLEYAYARLQEEFVYVREDTLSGTVDQRSRLWGIGPQFGFELDYALCQRSCGWLPGTLSLRFLSSASLLASRSNTKNFQRVGAALLVDHSDQKTWRVVPAWHARVGLNYDMCFSCFNSALEVGYEFNSYSRALSRFARPTVGVDGESFTNYYNFDIQGLYVSLGFIF